MTIVCPHLEEVAASFVQEVLEHLPYVVTEQMMLKPNNKLY